MGDLSVNNVSTVNMGQKFGAWTAGALKGFFNDQKIDDFDFLGSIAKGTRITRDVYLNGTNGKDGIIKLSRDSIKLADTNGDGKLNCEEFKQKEIDIFKQGLPSGLADDAKLENMSQTKFKTIDLNNDGFIDEKEQAALYATMDQDTSTGEVNGKIGQDEYVKLSINSCDKKCTDGVKGRLNQIYDFLFNS